MKLFPSQFLTFLTGKAVLPKLLLHLMAKPKLSKVCLCPLSTIKAMKWRQANELGTRKCLWKISKITFTSWTSDNRCKPICLIPTKKTIRARERFNWSSSKWTKMLPELNTWGRKLIAKRLCLKARKIKMNVFRTWSKFNHLGKLIRRSLIKP